MGIRGLPSTYSGYETFAEAIGSALVERGHEVLVYCRSALYQQKLPAYRGMQLIYQPSLESKEFSTLSHTWFCMADVLRRQTDVILVCNVGNGLHLIVPRLAGRKTAINVDGLEWKRPKWPRLGQLYFRFAARMACLLADRIICDAAAMTHVYKHDFGVDAATIAYGADTAISTRPDVVRQYGLEPARYFLVLARMIPDNNADLIVDAFSNVQTTMKLAIVGDANYKSVFVTNLRQTRDTRVLFLGHVSDKDHLRELGCNAYAHVHGHEFGGTNPALLSALGCGECVLALDTPFNREVLAGDYGILFRKDRADLTQKMQGVVDQPDVRDRYASRARSRIEAAYTWQHVTDQYEMLLRELAGK